MRLECADAVAKVLGRSVSQAELDAMEVRLTRAMRGAARQDPAAWQAKSQAEKLHEAAKIASQELVSEQVSRQKRAAIAVNAVAQSVTSQREIPE